MKKILIVPEFHLRDVEISSMRNYTNDIKDIFDNVVDVVKERKPDYTFLMGDVFDRQIKSSSKAVYWYQRFQELSNLTDLYSLIGNHELTYQTIFWDLVCRSSTNCSKTKPRQPKGLTEIIKIRDSIDIEGLTIDFIHYGGNIGNGDIALLHDDYINKSLKKFEEQDMTYLNFIETKNADDLSRYQISFIGHMHLMYGDFQWENGNEIIYLGSLGRTKETEVQDNFLERSLWELSIDDGKVVDLKPIKISLKGRYETLKDNLNMKVYKEEEQKIRLEKTAISYKDLDFIKSCLNQYGNLSDNKMSLLVDTLKDDFKFLERLRQEY